MSELVQVRIKGLVSTSRYGTMVSGDILRTDAEFAKHLVNDCLAAEYITEPARNPAPESMTQGKKKARR